MIGWEPIANAPKDGSLVELTWEENGAPAEIHTMSWGHIQRNGLFPGVVGMWVASGGGYTWNDHAGGGPTHWRRPPARKEAGDADR